MTLFEDIQSGKYNLVLFGIILVLFYRCYLMTPEYFSSVTPVQETSTSNLVNSEAQPSTIPQSENTPQLPAFNDTIYYANFEDIRKVASIINKIESDGLNFNGKIKEGGNELLPKGSIIIWSGPVTAIPAGWTLCDGQNGTPNLSGRFILGVGQRREVGQTGGLESVALSANQIPAHTHQITYRSDNDTTTNSYTGSATLPNNNTDLRKKSTNKTATSTAAGTGQTHDNMPPFYVLAYIMKL